MHTRGIVRVVSGLGAVAAVAFPLAACGSDSGGTATGGDAVAMMQSAMDGEGAVTCEITDAEQPGSMSIAGSDRYRILAQSDGETVNLLRDGSDVYVWKDGGGTGMKTTADSQTGMTLPNIQEAIDQEKASPTVDMECAADGDVDAKLVAPDEVEFQTVP